MIFLDYVSEDHSKIVSIAGFRRFIRIKKEIAFARPDEIDRLICLELAGEFDYTVAAPRDETVLTIGQSVRIVGVNITGDIATVKKINGNSVQLLVPGWSTVLTVDGCNVKPLDV
jgi:hypothetical protein